MSEEEKPIVEPKTCSELKVVISILLDVGHQMYEEADIVKDLMEKACPETIGD